MMSKNNNEERKCKICGKIIVGKTRPVFVLHVKRKPEIRA